MWQGGSQNMGGGFMDTSQFDSPSESKKDTNVRKSQNLFHASVAQIFSSPSDSLTIGKIDVNLLSMVAKVKSVDVSSTKIKYELEDDTGVIAAISWLDGDAEDSAKGPLVENTYCRIVGSIRSQEGNRYIMLLQAEPLTDANLLTSHLLGVVHNELMALKPSEQPERATNEGAGFAGGSGMVGGNPVKVEVQGGTVIDQVLRSVQKHNSSDSGVNKGQILKEVSGISARQIDEALEFLCNEGQVYTTVDDDHFKSTDSY